MRQLSNLSQRLLPAVTSTRSGCSSHSEMCVSRPFLFAAAALLVTTVAAAQNADSHGSGPFAAVVANSAFMHGYLHGYETGFHDGDLDLQMGRAPDPGRYSRESDGYSRDLGDKHAFRRGFRQGFNVAYADAFGGRSFRAVASLRGLQPSLAFSKGERPAVVDAAIVDGYQRGLRKGLADGRAGAVYTAVADPCNPPRAGNSYCSVFDGAFRLGYADGYINQRPVDAVTTTASK